MKRRPILAISLAAIFILPAVAGQQRRPPIHSTANMEHMKPKSGVSAMDRSFAKGAAIANMAEVKLGQLAQRNGGTWAKGFGRDMEREHTMAQKELMSLARSKKIALPADIDATHKMLYSRLSRLHGAAFDSAYRSEMIKGHTKVLAAIRKEIKSGNDTMVKGYAVKMEPAVEMHLRNAQEKKTMTMGHH